MRTYAEYLNTMTVKALNAIAKAMELTGYSKLRKDALITFVEAAIKDLDTRYEDAETINGWHVIALDMNKSIEESKDAPKIAAIMRSIASAPRKVAPVTFSHTPVKAPSKPVEPRKSVTPSKPANVYANESTEDLSEAYKYLAATLHNARGITHVKIAYKLRKISEVLRSRKVNIRALYV